MPLAAQIIAFLLVEAPQLIDLINKLRAEGRTQPTADELAALDLADADLDAAYRRLFPGAVPPAV